MTLSYTIKESYLIYKKLIFFLLVNRLLENDANFMLSSSAKQERTNKKSLQVQSCLVIRKNDATYI